MESMPKTSTWLLAITVLGFSCSDPGPLPQVRPVGSIKWRNIDVRGESDPVIDATTVYHLEQETHVLSAVRRADGSLVWRRSLPVANPAFDGYGLALSKGVLIVGDLDVFGVNPATGDILWRYQPSVGANPGFQRFTLAGGVIYCGSTTGHIFSVDAQTGIELWATKVTPEATSIYDPAVVDGVLFAGFTRFGGGVAPAGGAVAVNATTGKLMWSVFAPAPGPDFETSNVAGVAVFGTRAFFGTAAGVHVVDRTTGSVLQTLPASLFVPGGGRTALRAFAAGGSLIITSDDGHVTLVDPVTLVVRWQQSATSFINAISSDGQSIFVPQYGALAALALDTGVPTWVFRSKSVGDPDEAFLAAPTFDDSLLYLAGSKSVYALRKR